MVAMAFLAAGYTLYKELKRKENLNLIPFQIEEMETGKPVNPLSYVWHALIGGLVGYKVFGMLGDIATSSPDPLNYLFSSKGHLVGGIGLALLSVVSKFISQKKEAAQGYQKKKVKIFPSDRVGDIAMIAAAGGFAGAKIFNAFETWDQFIQDPLGSLFSSSGLTFYGGLIVATVALWFYARKIKLDFRHLCDAAAPGLILAYAIGRLGCQVSGDGDWGIYNAAYATNANGQVVTATQPFSETKKMYQAHLKRHFSASDSIPHASFKAPSGIPVWLVAYNYPHNVNGIGVDLKDCKGTYCSVLPMPVFPTPLYEFTLGTIIFLILWFLRKRFTTPLTIFSLYLVLNGIERFFIEKIRVNALTTLFGLEATQAEFIAVGIFMVGILLFIFRKPIDRWMKSLSAPQPTA